jgi:hypothetical protein
VNRSEATFLAHLDAIETRIGIGFAEIRDELRLIREDLAGIKLDLATHRHEGD